MTESKDIHVLTLDDPNYPAELKEIYAPPATLWAKGDLSVLRTTRFAIVGAREASRYGLETASRLARELAEAGVTIVSGMARGIDSAAHSGALAAGAPTIAVLGCGLSMISKGEPMKMAQSILDHHGLILSEFPLDTMPAKHTFPRRNCTISGLSRGVLVVEARFKSGALITADAALEQGRDVYATPGNVDSPLSQGTNKILKQGAKLVTCVEDILEDLHLKTPAAPMGPPTDLSAEESALFSFLGADPRHVDELIEEAALSPARAIAALSVLELKGLAKQLPGKNYVTTR